MKQSGKTLGLTKSRLLLWTVVVIGLLLAILSVWSKLSFIRDQFIALAYIIAVILLLLITALLGVLLWLLFHYLSTDEDDIIVLPFDIASGEDKLNSRALADEYTARCLSIKQTLERQVVGVEAESVKFGREVTADKEQVSRDLVNFATVGVGTTTVSIGQMIVGLRRLWPGSRGTTFSGTLQRYEKAISLTMSVKEGTKAHVWEVSKEIGKESEIPGLVRDLAFKVLVGTDKARIESHGSSYLPSVGTETKAAPSQTDPSPSQTHSSKRVALSAKTWVGLKHYADAREAYYQFQLWGNEERLEDARLATLRAVTAEPDYTKALSMLWILGNLYAQRGDSSKAGEMFRHAIRAINLGATNEAISRIDLLVRLGWSLIKDGNVHNAPEAIQVLCEVTKDNRRFSFAWSNLGIAYDLLGNVERATKAHDISLKGHSREAGDTIWWTEGRVKGLLISTHCLFAFGKYRDAVLRCQQAIEAVDENDRSELLETSISMADLLTGEGHFTKALEECRQAAKICGESASLLDKEAYIHLTLGNFGRADDLLHKALQQDGDASTWSSTWHTLGQLRYCQGHYQEAIDHFRKARDLALGSPDPCVSLAGLYRRTGRKDEYGDEVAAAHDRFSKGFNWPYSRACFAAVRGDLDEALRQLEIALQRRHVHPKWVRRDPDLDFIRDEKRYKDLMKRYKDVTVLANTEVRHHITISSKFKGGWRELKGRTQRILHAGDND
jgi:tetratricopeptide (TPR) repeat protein